MNTKNVTFNALQSDLMRAASLTNILGWAAVGQSYAGAQANINHNIGEFDIKAVAETIHDLLTDISSDLDRLERQIESHEAAPKTAVKAVQP